MKLKTGEGLEESARPLREAGWVVSTNALVSNPRHGLPKIAGEWKADLIMMGSHGRGAFSRLLMGSTAQAVMRHATCSVEIVRPRQKNRLERTGMRVMIPTDGSEMRRCRCARWRIGPGRQVPNS